MVDITKFPRPYISEEKTVPTLESNTTKNVRIPAKDNFRGCRHCDFTGDLKKSGASQVVLVVKNLPANAGDTGDTGLIPGSERSPGAGMTTCSSILAWRNPRTEEPRGLQSVEPQRGGHGRGAKQQQQHNRWWHSLPFYKTAFPLTVEEHLTFLSSHFLLSYHY